MFYTYFHRRDDTGQVFYVGKGSGRRAWTKSSRSRHWRSNTSKVAYSVEICATWAKESDAFLHEISLLKDFAGVGHPLINQTTGGDGASGLIHTMGTRQRMSTTHKLQHANNPQLALDASKKFKRMWSDLAVKAKIIQQRKDTWLDPLVKARRVAAMHANDMSLEVKRRRSEAQHKVQSTPESRALQRRSRLLSLTPGGAKAKPVTCLSTGDRFDSAADAGRYFGVRPSNISSVCRGEKNHAQGLRFALTLTPGLVH